MKWHQAVWVLGIAGGLGLVSACGDDDDNPGGSGGTAGKGGTGNEAGKAGGGTAGKAGGGTGGEGGSAGGGASECPADLANADGKACSVDGQQCLDPADPCVHNFSVECVDGKWEALAGVPAPCGGAGGGGAGGGGEAGGGAGGGGASGGGAGGNAGAP